MFYEKNNELNKYKKQKEEKRKNEEIIKKNKNIYELIKLLKCLNIWI